MAIETYIHCPNCLKQYKINHTLQANDDFSILHCPVCNKDYRDQDILLDMQQTAIHLAFKSESLAIRLEGQYAQQ